MQQAITYIDAALGASSIGVEKTRSLALQPLIACPKITLQLTVPQTVQDISHAVGSSRAHHPTCSHNHVSLAPAMHSPEG